MKSRLELTMPKLDEPPSFSIMKDNTVNMDPRKSTFDRTGTLPKLNEPPSFSILKDSNETTTDSIIEPKKSKLEHVESSSDQGNEFLTAEKFDETMTINFRKCFNTSAINLTNLTNLPDLKTQNFSKFYQTTSNFTNMYQTNFTLPTKTIDINQKESSNDSDNGANDTILNAILDPFSCDIKNRLLRKRSEYLKNKENYIEIEMNMPTIQQNSIVSLPHEAHKVIKEIGTGAYAKIFLIEKLIQKKKLALKVIFFNTIFKT